MRVTIKQIAEQSGVSIGTASRILSHKGQVHTPETRERVLQAAATLGYRANASARAVRSGRFNTVALLLSVQGVRSLLPDGLLEGIHDALAEHGQRLLVTRLTDEILTDPEFVPEILAEAAADGLLIKYDALIPPRLIELIRQHHIPSIWINSRQAADCVFPDDFQAGYDAATYFYQQGHRNIGYLDLVRAQHYSADDRLAGFVAALEERGIPPLLGLPEKGLPQRQHLEWTCNWLATLGPRRTPLALFTYNLHVARAAILAAAQYKLRIPEELSLLTVDDRVSEDMGIYVGTLLLPQYHIGQRAVNMLMDRIAAPHHELPPCSFPLTLTPGETNAAV